VGAISNLRAASLLFASNSRQVQAMPTARTPFCGDILRIERFDSLCSARRLFFGTEGVFAAFYAARWVIFPKGSRTSTSGSNPTKGRRDASAFAIAGRCRRGMLSIFHGPNLLRYSCEVTKPVTIPRGLLVLSSSAIQSR
jgi:hypothetical protein